MCMFKPDVCIYTMYYYMYVHIIYSMYILCVCTSTMCTCILHMYVHIYVCTMYLYTMMYHVLVMYNQYYASRACLLVCNFLLDF